MTSYLKEMNIASVAALPTVEIAAYCLIWVGGIFYSAYNVYSVSESKSPRNRCYFTRMSICLFWRLDYLQNLPIIDRSTLVHVSLVTNLFFLYFLFQIMASSWEWKSWGLGGTSLDDKKTFQITSGVCGCHSYGN